MDPLPEDLITILRAAIDGVDAGRLVRRALEDREVVDALRQARSVDVLSAGKAAGVMLEAFAAGCPVPLRRMVGIGPANPPALPEGAEWQDADHPLPSERSRRYLPRATFPTIRVPSPAPSNGGTQS